MTQLRYLAIAALILAGCRKETKPPAGGGSAPVADGAAAAIDAPAIDAAAPEPDPPGPAAPPRPAAQGEQCPEGTPCEAGLTCVKFVGVTGRPLATCEIPCDKGARCPAGQACATVKDGPGQVCQPKSGGGGTGGGGTGGGGTGGTGGTGGGGTGGTGGTGGSGTGGTGGTGGTPTLPQQEQPCAEGRCAPGLACVEYYGIAGPRGGKFTSCEIRCSDGTRCPAGQSCVTVADGPGQVCRK